MSNEREYEVGDQILIVGDDYEGELGTILAIAEDGKRYLVVFENGTRKVFRAESLSPRS